MKKYLLPFIMTAVLFTACKNDKKATDNEENIDSTAVTQAEAPKLLHENNTVAVLRGEFIYYDDAAVLNGNNFIYGVQLDDKAKDLASKVEELKKEKHDMVPVTVKAMVKENPMKDGWEQIIEIQEIIEVSEPVKDETIKI
ncbi:hypothetical protein [Mesonia sp. K7]|uniref:hypothetical protein n=1 Tax=Mesonia sp. K7 TaxID=2218606 RepID=UPI000DA9B32E|nr:hypothetical protein [Mesonia sp. K7]PZD78441.1 hypothetical protein DNG35_05105 [Mesonia sp. K7]